MAKIKSLKSKREITKLLKTGKFYKATNLAFYYLSDEILATDKLHYVLMVSKKRIPLAVKRNLVKRRIKDALRSFDTKFSIGPLAVVLRGKELPSYEFIKHDLNQFFNTFSTDNINKI